MLCERPVLTTRHQHRGPANTTNAGSVDGAANPLPIKQRRVSRRPASMHEHRGRWKTCVQKSQTFGSISTHSKPRVLLQATIPNMAIRTWKPNMRSIKRQEGLLLSGPVQWVDIGWLDRCGCVSGLNKDGRTDVVIVGKCSAKSADYNENMIYVNTGKAFTTNPDGNNQLSEFNTTKDVIGFVEDNQQIFFQ